MLSYEGLYGALAAENRVEVELSHCGVFLKGPIAETSNTGCHAYQSPGLQRKEIKHYHCPFVLLLRYAYNQYEGCCSPLYANAGLSNSLCSWL